MSEQWSRFCQISILLVLNLKKFPIFFHLKQVQRIHLKAFLTDSQYLKITHWCCPNNCYSNWEMCQNAWANYADLSLEFHVHFYRVGTIEISDAEPKNVFTIKVGDKRLKLRECKDYKVKNGPQQLKMALKNALYMPEHLYKQHAFPCEKEATVSWFMIYFAFWSLKYN